MKSPSDTARRLYVLDYGLFEVSGAGRRIGIQGYLIQSEGENILVDLGFPPHYVEDPASAAREDGLDAFGRVLQLAPENLPSGQLAKIGLSLQDIDTLVLTHTDIDHIGDVSRFGHTRIVVGHPEQEHTAPRELGAATRIEWPAETEYTIVRNDRQIAVGVMVLTTPGHSPGHLSLLVQLPEQGAVLITGDAISRPEELESGFGNASDPQQAARSAAKLMELAEREDAFIIYGHDPEQWGQLRKAPQAYQ